MDKLHQFAELAFGSRIKRLSDTLMKDVKQVYKDLYIDFEPTHFPIFKTIYEEKQVNISKLSELLQLSQPAITQFINALQKKQLIKIVTNKTDKRKKIVQLSEKGHLMMDKLIPIWKVIGDQLTELIENEPTSFMNHIKLTELKQKKQSLYKRIMNHQKNQVEIISYKGELAKIFLNLNIEWLDKYFYVENHDKEVLSNPKSYIIDNGGHIFFAKYNNEIVGTVALINNPEGFELSKMAVSPKYRGLKIGQKMMEHCIEFAKENKWDKLILYSSRKLENAIYIYRKYNFIEVEIEENCPYERCDIKMILKL